MAARPRSNTEQTAPRPPEGDDERAVAHTEHAVGASPAPSRPLGRALPHRGVAVGAVLCFLIAGAAGLIYRWGLGHGFPASLRPDDLRHAHSHLMMQGWLTPALFLLMRSFAQRESALTLPKALDRLSGLAVLLSLPMFVAFSLHGYRPVAIGRASIPLGAVLTGLGVLVWYAWVAVWFYALRGRRRSLAMRFWNASLILLLVASAGAWAQMALTLMKVRHPFWDRAMIHLFLDVFSDGWILAAFLGFAWALIAPWASGRGWGATLLLHAAPLLFLVGMPTDRVPPALAWVGRAAALVVAGVVLSQLWALARRRPPAHFALRLCLALMGLKGVMFVALSVPALARWGQLMGLRIFYLHVGFVGVLTVLAFVLLVGRGVQGLRLARFASVSALLLLSTLVPLTGVWPQALSGFWVIDAAFVGSLPMFATGLYALYVLLRPRGQRTRPDLAESSQSDPHRRAEPAIFGFA